MSKRDRQIVLLEWLAATSLFAIVAIVLYMVFEYRPA
jgi:type II secretory pathway component PulJ